MGSLCKSPLSWGSVGGSMKEAWREWAFIFRLRPVKRLFWRSCFMSQMGNKWALWAGTAHGPKKNNLHEIGPFLHHLVTYTVPDHITDLMHKACDQSLSKTKTKGGFHTKDQSGLCDVNRASWENLHCWKILRDKESFVTHLCDVMKKRTRIQHPACCGKEYSVFPFSSAV